MTPVPLKKAKSPKRAMSVSKRSKQQASLLRPPKQPYKSPAKKRKTFQQSPIKLNPCYDNPEDVMKSLDELEMKH